MQRIITLITDFGSEEHFAGAIKGAILTVNPDVTIVSITHEVKPYSIMDGALALKSSYCYFPPRSIHVVVVDPGVGGHRRCLLISTDKYFFVGPDNGVFSFVVDELDNYTCYEITARHYFRRDISPTFHGRDIFAPVAAWLSKGIGCHHFGNVIDDPIMLPLPRAHVSDGTIEGEILHIDRFGNLITTISKENLANLEPGKTAVCRLEGIDQKSIPLCTYYGEVGIGDPCSLLGSSGFLEVAVNRGQASMYFNVEVGHRISISAE